MKTYTVEDTFNKLRRISFNEVDSLLDGRFPDEYQHLTLTEMNVMTELLEDISVKYPLSYQRHLKEICTEYIERTSGRFNFTSHKDLADFLQSENWPYEDFLEKSFDGWQEWFLANLRFRRYQYILSTPARVFRILFGR